MDDSPPITPTAFEPQVARARAAIFLDRDGTVIQDTRYPTEASTIELLDGARDCLRIVRESGFKLIIISNQSGIGRGLSTVEDFYFVNEKIESLLNFRFDGAYLCPHRPDDSCPCRKPSPAMIIQGAKEHSIARHESWMIGDQASDIAAGIAAGCKTIWLFSATHDRPQEVDYVATNWRDILYFIEQDSAVSHQ